MDISKIASMRDNRGMEPKEPGGRGRSARPSLEDVQRRLDAVLPLLNAGRLNEAIPKLESLTRWGAPHAGVLYNLGLALSQAGRLDVAILRLKRAVELEPDHDNAWVGLGVAQGRMGRNEEAASSFRTALQISPDNPYAHRNLSANLLSSGLVDEAEAHLIRAQQKLPNDPQVLLGLGLTAQARAEIHGNDLPERTREDSRVAEAHFKRVVQLDPESDAADVARSALTRMASRAFNRGGLRPDVMFYMMGALDRFEKQGPAHREAMTLEIALLGRRGLDIHNPERTYTLKGAPGESFTGLHLLSIMYVGLKQLKLPMDQLGPDFSAEFSAACVLKERRTSDPGQSESGG